MKIVLWELLLRENVYSAFHKFWKLKGKLQKKPLKRAFRSFPSSLVPLFQNKFKCETFLMKMTLIYMKMKLQVELTFIWIVSNLDSFWNRGTRELRNGLLTCESRGFQITGIQLHKIQIRSPVIGHPLDRAPITCHIGRAENQSDRELCYRYD